MIGNQRQYFRCAFESHSCVLIAGRRAIPCELVDMSLGGFAVTIPEPMPETVDSLMRLKVRDLEYIVRLARQEHRPEGVRLALEQVEEVVPPADQIPTTPLGRVMTRAAWIVAFCLVLAALYCLSGLTPPLSVAG